MKLRSLVYPLALLALATGIALSGCSKKEDNPVAPTTPTDTIVHFQTQIEPIFQARCAPCHITTTPRTGSLYLDNYDSLMFSQGWLFGSPINVGSSSTSLIIKKLMGTQDSTQGIRMPKSGPPYLSQDSIDLIAKWIDQGALNN